VSAIDPAAQCGLISGLCTGSFSLELAPGGLTTGRPSPPTVIDKNRRETLNVGIPAHSVRVALIPAPPCLRAIERSTQVDPTSGSPTAVLNGRHCKYIVVEWKCKEILVQHKKITPQHNETKHWRKWRLIAEGLINIREIRGKDGWVYRLNQRPLAQIV